ISRMPEFQGKIIFLENYDIALAKRLISGVDIWLNTPTRPLEASGTSGQKAEMNGVLNFSVLDGWWLEGYKPGAGWALTEKRTYQNQAFQDQLDAATIYSMLENEIIPLYYAKNSKGFSPEWIQYIKNSIAKIAPVFTTKRMLDDYIDRFYTKLAKRAAYLCDDNYAKAKELVVWKEKMAAAWDKIEVAEVSLPEALVNNAQVGEEHPIRVSLNTAAAGINAGVGVELVVETQDVDGNLKYVTYEMNQVKAAEGKMDFELTYRLKKAGAFKYAFRMFPKHADLPHRQDFCFVRWF
ncbi:MAG: alpha-glucan family phosphorylase, partial [Bacteroidales bacterium]|nr:alpha-glucan family phosphorylase [Bacteroidales bacterium]